MIPATPFNNSINFFNVIHYEIQHLLISNMTKGGIFEAGFGEKVAFYWPSVDRFGKFLGGLMTLGQVKSVLIFC